MKETKAEIQARVARAMQRSRAEKKERETPAPAPKMPEPEPEPELSPAIETPENTMTLEGRVEKSSRKIGATAKATIGHLEMNLKHGGTTAGTLVVDYMNRPFLNQLSKLTPERRDRKFRVTITIEEI